jgi:hypothetical protein
MEFQGKGPEYDLNYENEVKKCVPETKEVGERINRLISRKKFLMIQEFRPVVHDGGLTTFFTVCKVLPSISKAFRLIIFFHFNYIR